MGQSTGSGGRSEDPRLLAVIIGGGVIGASVAYHLTRLGWGDVVLLERKSLTSGTTWHAAGLVGRLRGSRTLSRLVRYSAELYARLESETGLSTNWKQCGSLIVARRAERLTQFRRSVALGRYVDIEAHIVGPDEVRRAGRSAASTISWAPCGSRTTAA